jgi:hypothetical protein
MKIGYVHIFDDVFRPLYNCAGGESCLRASLLQTSSRHPDRFLLASPARDNPVYRELLVAR